MIRGKREGSNYSTWFIGFDHEQSDTPPSPSPTATSGRPSSRGTGSVDSLHSSPAPTTPRQLRPRTPEPTRKVRTTKDDKSRASGPLRALPKWDEDRPTRGQVKKVTKDLYKHAFESARQAEEDKFKRKFDVVIHDLKDSLEASSSHGVPDTLSSTSYGEVLLSYRARVKDLLIVFSRRLQLAYESFESGESSEDHTQLVKQNVSRFMDDLLGESLDLTSDEAVSDLSSLSDDSSNERHAFEDQIAQAVVSKVLETHRREVHLEAQNDLRLDHRLSSPALIPEALNDDENDDDDDRNFTTRTVKDTDISKDFEDLKNFVQETQSRSRQFEDYGADDVDGGEGVTDFRGSGDRSGARVRSSFDTRNRDRDFPPLPDFSDLEQIDFDSGEVDPDYLQMNLAVIPEETEEELEEDALDTQWRDNWIFKGQGSSPPLHQTADRSRMRGDHDPPQYMMVPRPDDNLAPRVGNRDVDQLSDFSDNEDNTASDDTSLYPHSSEELSRTSRYKRPSTTPSLTSPSLIPSRDEFFPDDEDFLIPQDSYSKQASDIYNVDLDYVDDGEAVEDLAGPIVEPSHRELKLLDDLVPADDDDPKFVTQPESVTIQEGEPVKFSCVVSGTQPIDVFWYREHAEVEELEESEDVELQVEGTRHSATLYNVAHRHAGQYMCIALSDTGKAIKYLIVTVKDNKQELKKPEFLRDLKDIEVMEGQNVKFRCKVKGYPPPRIHWYKDGALLKSSRSCRIEKFGNRDYILSMDGVTLDDDAEYMVVARNVAGEVKSTAQVIVDSNMDGQSMLSKSESQSMSTLYSDSDSDRPSSTVTEDAPALSEASRKDSGLSTARPRELGVGLGASLINKLTSVSHQDSAGVALTPEELSTVNAHLEDMERRLDLEGFESSDSADVSLCQSTDGLDDGLAVDDDGVDNNDADMADRPPARRLTPNKLSVLRAAEEIIHQENNTPETSTTTASSRPGVRSSASTDPVPQDSKTGVHSFGSTDSITQDHKIGVRNSVSADPILQDHKTGVRGSVSADSMPQYLNSVSEPRRSSSDHCDLDKSVSSGYGSGSMASSGVDLSDSDSVIMPSSHTQQLPTSFQGSGLSHGGRLSPKGSLSHLEPPSPVGSSLPHGNPSSPVGSSMFHGNLPSPQDEFAIYLPPLDDDSSGSYREEVNISLSSNSKAKPKTNVTNKTNTNNNARTNTNTGPKPSPYTQNNSNTNKTNIDKQNDLSSMASKRTVTTSLGRTVQPKSTSVSESHSNKSSPSLALENKQPVSLQLKKPVKNDFESPTGKEELDSKPVHGSKLVLDFGPKEVNPSAYKRDYEVKGAVGETEERKRWSVMLDHYSPSADVVNKRHNMEDTEEKMSPRSSRGSSSNSSTISTSRESLDSGVSCSQSAPERAGAEKPIPVHLVGETQEEEVPESRAEYDSGIELPSVSRLKAMFGSGSKRDEAAFKRRIHSITARSLSKDQLQKLRDGDAPTPRQSRQQSRSAIQLSNPGTPAVASQFHGEREDHSGVTPSTVRMDLSSQRLHQTSAPVERRRIRTANPSEPAQSQQPGSSHQSSLVFPNQEHNPSGGISSSNFVSRIRSKSPRPKSAIIDASRLSLPNNVSPRARVQSESDSVESPRVKPKIRSGCISARAAFWERRILHGKGTEDNGDHDFPDMADDSQA